MLENYLPVLIFILVGFGFGTMLIVVGLTIAPNKLGRVLNNWSNTFCKEEVISSNMMI